MDSVSLYYKQLIPKKIIIFVAILKNMVFKMRRICFYGYKMFPIHSGHFLTKFGYMLILQFISLNFKQDVSNFLNIAQVKKGCPRDLFHP